MFKQGPACFVVCKDPIRTFLRIRVVPVVSEVSHSHIVSLLLLTEAFQALQRQILSWRLVFLSPGSPGVAALALPEVCCKMRMFPLPLELSQTCKRC